MHMRAVRELDAPPEGGAEAMRSAGPSQRVSTFAEVFATAPCPDPTQAEAVDSDRPADPGLGIDGGDASETLAVQSALLSFEALQFIMQQLLPVLECHFELGATFRKTVCSLWLRAVYCFVELPGEDAAGWTPPEQWLRRGALSQLEWLRSSPRGLSPRLAVAVIYLGLLQHVSPPIHLAELLRLCCSGSVPLLAAHSMLPRNLQPIKHRVPSTVILNEFPALAGVSEVVSYLCDVLQLPVPLPLRGHLVGQYATSLRAPLGTAAIALALLQRARRSSRATATTDARHASGASSMPDLAPRQVATDDMCTSRQLDQLSRRCCKVAAALVAAASRHEQHLSGPLLPAYVDRSSAWSLEHASSEESADEAVDVSTRGSLRALVRAVCMRECSVAATSRAPNEADSQRVGSSGAAGLTSRGVTLPSSTAQAMVWVESGEMATRCASYCAASSLLPRDGTSSNAGQPASTLLRQTVSAECAAMQQLAVALKSAAVGTGSRATSATFDAPRSTSPTKRRRAAQVPTLPDCSADGHATAARRARGGSSPRHALLVRAAAALACVDEAQLLDEVNRIEDMESRTSVAGIKKTYH